MFLNNTINSGETAYRGTLFTLILYSAARQKSSGRFCFLHKLANKLAELCRVFNALSADEAGFCIKNLCIFCKLVPVGLKEGLELLGNRVAAVDFKHKLGFH